MSTLNIKELPLLSKARICWGFFWRGIVATIGSALCGGLLGVIAGFILALIGAPRGAGVVVGGVLGTLSGLFFLYLLVRWLLSTRIGSYRLVLTHAAEKI